MQDAVNSTLKVKNHSENRGLQLKFHEVPSAGLDMAFSQTSGELNGLMFDIMGDFPVYNAQVQVMPLDQMVQVKGQVNGELRVICSRCAEEYSETFKKNFVTAFYKSEQSLKNFGWQSDDLNGSFDLEFLEGEMIDVGEVIHEQIALEIPFQPLCMENCKGLCLQCGINKNKASCQCKPIEFKDEKPNSPFEKLKALRGEN